MGRKPRVVAETVQSETVAVVEAQAPIGVFEPSGSAESIAKCKATPRYWDGVALNSDGEEVQVTAQCDTRQGSLRIFTTIGASKVQVGSLDKVTDGQRYEGTLGKDRKVRAFFRNPERGNKTTLRILLEVDDGRYSEPVVREMVKARSLKEMLADVGPLTRADDNSTEQPSNDVPF